MGILTRRAVRSFLDEVMEKLDEGSLDKALEILEANKGALARFNKARFRRRAERIAKRRPTAFRKFRLRLLAIRQDPAEAWLEAIGQ